MSSHKVTGAHEIEGMPGMRIARLIGPGVIDSTERLFLQAELEPCEAGEITDTQMRSKQEITEMLIILRVFGDPQAAQALEWVLGVYPPADSTATMPAMRKEKS